MSDRTKCLLICLVSGLLAAAIVSSCLKPTKMERGAKWYRDDADQLDKIAALLEARGARFLNADVAAGKELLAAAEADNMRSMADKLRAMAVMERVLAKRMLAKSEPN